MKSEIERLFKEGISQQQAGEITQAINSFEHLLSLAPHHLEGLRFLGLAYAQMGDWYNAIAYFKQALLRQPNDANLHTNLGQVYKKMQNMTEAIAHYHQALMIEPAYPQAHNHLASIYALQGNYPSALHHYYLAVKTAPDYIDAHYNLGLLFLKHHELTAARTEFKNVLALNADYIHTHFYLGLLDLKDNQLDQAEQHFLHMLAADADHVESLVNLGVIALKKAQLADDATHGQRAIDYFTKALLRDEHHLEARNNLAATFMYYDRYENALRYYLGLIQEDPDNYEYLYNTAVAQMALGHLREAQRYFEKLLSQHPHDFSALSNLAAIQMRLDHRSEAITLLRQALQVKPEDAVSQFMLQALVGQQAEPRGCPEYVQNLFNNYALYYEPHLQETLKYTLPQQIHQLLQSIQLPQKTDVLDLGCGTGLTGMVLRDYSAHLFGVDIAEKMIAKARAKGIYDQLFTSELLTFLQTDPHHYNLIVAADVLPYLGELTALFQAITKRLTPNGFFIFTCEICTTESWRLQTNIRFCHHPDYILQLCQQNQLTIQLQQPIIARQQAHQDVPVQLFVVTPRVNPD